jgi:phospholipid/cholesterol/gamma-HCH transport system substrate-binding protein
MTRHVRRLGALLAALVVLSGCGFRGAYSLTLPGGADVGNQPYTVQAQFDDVLDLVPQSGVRVANVPVGRVTDIKLGSNWTAVVTMIVNSSVKLPANATAKILQSSLLGEKYVQLAAPTAEASQGQLRDGALIPISRTGRSVEVEELLGALSLVLNGGGLANLQTINHELGIALQGRESGVRDTLVQLQGFIGGLDQQKAEINRALDSANALTGTLAAHTQTLKNALDDIGPGLAVLNQQRDLLVQMLQSLARLGDVGTRIINEAGANTVADLQLLQPIISQLAAAGSNLTGSLQLLLTYPFTDKTLSALDYRPDSHTGGYGLWTNMTATLNLDLREVLCRYAVDNVTGQLKLVFTPEQVAAGQCGQAGTPPSSTSSTQSSSQASSTPTFTTLGPNIVGQLVTPGAGAVPQGPVGFPGLTGVKKP